MDIYQDSAGNQSEVEVFPVAIGLYDHHEALDVAAEVRRVVELLEDVGGYEVPWLTNMADRGADAVNARLSVWSNPSAPVDTVLYWVGHGWSDGQDASLAHARSPAAVRTLGVIPAQLSEPVRTRQITAVGRWAIVVADTCWSSRFIDLVQAQLAADAHGADAVMLVGVSGDGATSLGRFSNALAACIQENFRAARVIELWQLVQEMDRRLPEGLVIGRRLGDAALVRRVTPLAGSLPAPLDLLRDVEEAMAELGESERRHFLTKAQAAEEGEVCWFFEGRQRERSEIVQWLRTAESGMLVVSGRAGSGKSALLGHVLMHSLPDLRDVLIRAGLVDPLPAGELPQDHVFDDVINLTGVTLHALVRRIALVASLGEPSTVTDSVTTSAVDMDWLLDGIGARAGTLTLLVDGLDEAQDPIGVARGVLRRVAALPGVRLVVGSRPSTRETPDHPTPNEENLLVALGVRREEAPSLVWMSRDPAAMVRYVTRRLGVARDRGTLTIAGRPVEDVQIQHAAEVVCGPGREFLFARLAVYELLAVPKLLAAAGEPAFAGLLAGDHRELFSVAVERLSGLRPPFRPLLEALALARGRGIPILDGIWASIAASLAGSLVITDDDISALLADAEPYIVVDAEMGQTVYRLAHRTFVEYFYAQWED